MLGLVRIETALEEQRHAIGQIVSRASVVDAKLDNMVTMSMENWAAAREEQQVAQAAARRDQHAADAHQAALVAVVLNEQKRLQSELSDVKLLLNAQARGACRSGQRD
jgi:hypothetical protein